MRNYGRLVCLSALSAMLTGCGVIGGGGCSAVELDVLVERGMFANNVSARIENNSDDERRVTISAADPDGNASTVGPLTIAANGSRTVPLGPLLTSYGSNQAELERSGASFEIIDCE